MSDRTAEIRERLNKVAHRAFGNLRRDPFFHHNEVKESVSELLDTSLTLLTRIEEAEKVIQEALSETVDASVYPDGPNMSRELRADMRRFLEGG